MSRLCSLCAMLSASSKNLGSCPFARNGVIRSDSFIVSGVLKKLIMVFGLLCVCCSRVRSIEGGDISVDTPHEIACKDTTIHTPFANFSSLFFHFLCNIV